MLLVKTYLGQSPIDGIGVFADEFIPKGSAIWRFEPLIDKVITLAECAELPATARYYVEKHAEFFQDSEFFVLSGDNDKFINHSNLANTDVTRPNDFDSTVYAVEDIQPGVEITCDYGVIKVVSFPVK